MTDTTEVQITSVLDSTNEPYLQKVGGRKFVLVMMCCIATFALCWFGKIDPGIYSVVIVSLAGGYITGNVVQKITTTPK